MLLLAQVVAITDLRTSLIGLSCVILTTFYRTIYCSHSYQKSTDLKSKETDKKIINYSMKCYEFTSALNHTIFSEKSDDLLLRNKNVRQQSETFSVREVF